MNESTGNRNTPIDITHIPERIAYLIFLYLHGKLTPSGRREIDFWIAQSKEHQQLFDNATNFDLLD